MLLIDIKIIMIVEACGSQDMGALGLASSVFSEVDLLVVSRERRNVIPT